MRRHVRHPIVLAIALLFLACLPARAAEAADPPIQFAPADPLVVSWSQLQKEPFTVAIQNLTTTSQEVRVELGDLDLRDRSKAPVKTPDVIACGGTITLEPARAARIACAISSTPDLLPGSYAGTIVASIPAANVVVQRTIRLVVSNAAGTVPLPAADAWSTTITRPLFGLGGTQARDIGLPVRIAAGVAPQDLALVKDRYLGFVATANGQSSAVAWTGGTTTLPGGLTGLRLRLASVGQAGKYEGAIDLDPTDDKTGAVKLAITVTDLAIWPILALALGIGLALAIQRYLGVLRTVWLLREDEARLREDMAKARWHFAGKAHGQPYAGLDLATDANAQLEALRRGIDALRGRFFVTLDTKDATYTALLAARQQLATAIAQWEPFADDLGALKQKCATVSYAQVAPPPAPHGGAAFTRPAFLKDAEALLSSGSLRVGEFAGRRERVTKATTLAKAWGDLMRGNLHAREEIAAMLSHPGLSKEQRAKLHSARDAANRAWYDLWDAQDADDLARRKTTEALFEVEEQLAELRPFLAVHVTDAMTKAAAWRELLAPFDGLFGGDFSSREAAASPAETAHHYAQLRQRWDWALTAIALVIAVWTGLNALYVGKPFGTAIDYANALCWGVATKATVEAAAALLEKLRGSGNLLTRAN